MYYESHTTGLYKQEMTIPLKGKEILEDHIKDGMSKILMQIGPWPKEEKGKKKHLWLEGFQIICSATHKKKKD
jgi:hypothetical protein